MKGMQSVEQETIPFKTNINTAQAKGAVERWLLEVRVPTHMPGNAGLSCVFLLCVLCCAFVWWLQHQHAS